MDKHTKTPYEDLTCVTVDQVGVEERVSRLTKRSIKKESKVWALKMALSMCDLTTLEGKDSPGKIRQLCNKAIRPHDDLDIPSVAAVCVYPSLVRLTKSHLKGTKIQVASVATAFPSGQSNRAIKLAETHWAVEEGADSRLRCLQSRRVESSEWKILHDVAEVWCGQLSRHYFF